MFQFLAEKGYPYGIRCSMENFGIYQNIRVYPLYALSQAVGWYTLHFSLIPLFPANKGIREDEKEVALLLRELL